MADANVSQLEVNGTTYDICDATARDSLSNYVLKTGDTMTGTLNGTSAIFSGDISGDNATFSGDVSGDNATFLSDISASNATFSGDVSGDNATFSGDINGDNATLSGNIEAVRFTSDNLGLVVNLPTIEADIIPTETQYLHGLEFTDKNDLFLGGVQFIDNTSSNYQGMQIGVSKSDWDEQLLMYMGLSNVSHKSYVLYTHPLTFLDALCHDGSTGRRSYVQYTGSDVVNLNSTYATLVGATIIRWGRLIWLRIIYTNKTTWSIGANGDTGNVTIGKLKHFPPVENINLPSVGDHSGQALKPFINSAGDITVIGADATGVAYTVGTGNQQIINTCYMCQNNTANLT